MNKNIYDMINDIDTDFSEYQDHTVLDDITSQKLKQSFLKRAKSKKSYKGIIIAACCCLAVTGLAFGPFKSQVAAAGRLISYTITNALGMQNDLSPYEDVIDQTVTNEGVSITLNSVILAGDDLIVSTTEYVGDIAHFSTFGEIYINGRRCSDGSSGSSTELEDGVIGSVMEYSLSGIDTSDTLDIELELQDVTGTVKGTWKFAFQANGSELSAAMEEQPLDIGISLPNGSSITLNSFLVTPVGYRIYYTNSASDTNYDLKFTGTDNLGNPAEFYLSRSSKTDGYLSLDTLSGLISENADSLTLTPYAVPFPEKSGKLSDDWEKVGEAFTVNLP